MKKRKGKLIAIEGTDGSGKGTQTRRLVRRLRAAGVDARRIAFPQYGKSFFGGMAAAYLRGEYGAAGAVDPHLAAVLYAADRYEARGKIARALEAGTTLVLDRYVDSRVASELIGQKAARTHLHGKKRDLHEADLGHLRRAERAYLQLARACPAARGALLKCVDKGRLLSVVEIGERIWNLVSSL